MTRSGETNELVVLVHGYFSSRWLLSPLARRLQAAGYSTRSWSYYTLGGSNRAIGRRLAASINRSASRGGWSRVHVVTHSMGSIAMRCAFEEQLPAELGRVVMIGPPNRGSHVATRLAGRYGRLSRTLYELRDTPDSFVNLLPPAPAHVEVGVIATHRDRVVALECTHLEGQRDHCVISGMHTAALWTPACAEQAAHFLRRGEFLRVDAAVTTARRPADQPALTD